MNHLTNLVQFPGLGLSFQLNRVAFTIGGVSIYWYGAGRFWIESLRTDSLMLVPSIGLRASQLVAGIAVVAGIAAEVYFTRKFKGKPLFVPLAMNAENKAAQKKLDGPISFAGKDTQLLASSPRKLFLEKTEAYNAQVKAAIEQAGQKKA